VYFQDQNLNRIIANDPNVMISLIIRQGQTKREKYQFKQLLNSHTPKNTPEIIPLEFKE
jgi:hypothetical protein